MGTWAKTSLREDASFVLRCVFRASDGRTAEAVSSHFQVFSHQSQLPQRKGKAEKAASLKRVRSKRVLAKSAESGLEVFRAAEVEIKQEEADVFGLNSLSDAALKAASSEEAAQPAEDSRLKKKMLLERADDIALRIRTLQDEERQLRERAAVEFAMVEGF